MRCVAQVAVIITVPITTEVKGNSASSFEFELMDLSERFDDSRGVFAGDKKIVNVDCDIFIMVAHIA